jgi:hypothetical protein
MTLVLIMLGLSAGWASVCSCTGNMQTDNVMAGIVRNLLLIAGALVLIYLEPVAGRLAPNIRNS